MRWVLRTTLAGGVVGLVDALDLTLERTWTAGLHGFEGVGLVAAATLVAASAGALIGLIFAGSTWAARAVGFRWEHVDGLWLRTRRLVSRRYVLAALAVTVAAWSCGALSFKSALTLDPWQATAVIVPGLAGLSALGTRGRRTWVALGWAGVLAWAFYTEMRLIYGASRYGGALVYHAVSALGLVLLVAVGLSVGPFATRPTETRSSSRRRLAWAGVVLLLAVGVLGGTRMALDGTSNAFRTALYERTTIVYRLFSLLPFEPPAVGELAAAGSCAEESPAATAATEEPASGAAATPVRGMVVLMIDTLRADHAPHAAHEDGRALTPALDRLADSGTTFTSAYTTVPATRYAVRSLFSGATPIPLDLEPADSDWLAARLSADGVRTIGLIDHPHLEASMVGFDEVIELTEGYRHDHVNSERAFEKTRERLDQLGPDQRFFMFVHFYDPHGAYEPHPGFDFGASLHAAYDSEVAYTDHWAGQILEHLDALGLRDEVAVVVLADHGDELWEHRYRWHGVRVYDETTRVPFLMRVPGGPVGRAVGAPVSLVDFYPTVLDLFGVAAPAGIEGVSLVPAALGQPLPAERPVFMASREYPTFAAVQGERKVIINQATGVVEYYDLASDPGEQVNLADTAAAEFAGAYCRLVAWMAARVD